MDKVYKRVLIVNKQSIYKRNATGLTMRSLWGDWPSDRIVEFHTFEPYLEEDENSGIRLLTFKENLIDRLSARKTIQKANTYAKDTNNTARE